MFSELIDLHDVDQPGVEIRFEQLQRPLLQVQTILRVADLLGILQQTEEPADIARTATGKARATSARAAGLRS